MLLKEELAFLKSLNTNVSFNSNKERREQLASH